MTHKSARKLCPKCKQFRNCDYRNNSLYICRTCGKRFRIVNGVYEMSGLA